MGQQRVWGYTLSRLLYSGTKECGGTLFRAYYIQAAKSAGVHSFLPIYKLKEAAKSAGVHSFLPIYKLKGAAKSAGVHSFLPTYKLKGAAKSVGVYCF